MTSIRGALLWRLSLCAALLALAGAALLYFGVRWLLVEQLDGLLRKRLEAFAAEIEQEGNTIEVGFAEEPGPEFRAGPEPDYLELWFPDGQVVYRTDSLGGGDLPRRYGSEESPLTYDLALPDGRAGRAIGVEVVVDAYAHASEDDLGRAHMILALATSRERLDRALALLLWGSLGAIALLLGGGFSIARATVGRGLAPLAGLAGHVGAIQDPLRAAPFPADPLPAELAPLVHSHNRMLERIRAAFERERRTGANIAHELRTPLSELALLAEAAQRYADDPQETARRLGEMREIGGQMAVLISTLLELSRLESGAVPLEVEPIDLSEMLRATWSAFAPAAAAKGITFHGPEAAGPVVPADRAALSILLGNLLSNAVEHAPAGDRIGCELGTRAGAGFLALTNAANGLAAEDLDKLGEAFWRRSQARAERAHAGLGLSLVARLAALLHLELTYAVEDGQFRVQVHFPPAAPPRVAPIPAGR